MDEKRSATLSLDHRDELLVHKAKCLTRVVDVLDLAVNWEAGGLVVNSVVDIV